MERKFQQGDVVSLRSGGPEMVVAKVIEKAPAVAGVSVAVEEGVDCWWFNKEGDEHASLMKAAGVPLACLVLVKAVDEEEEEDKPARRGRAKPASDE